jgi:catechol 2,3-dioxygenase-like lactoylglutathione lyase family enzyme
MRLEHINLIVKDINKALEFYQAAFPHWSVRANGKADWHGVKRNWIHFGDDFQYLTFNDNGLGENRDLKGHTLGLAHFAYITENISDLVCRMQQAGFRVAKKGPENSYRENVYYIDPDGFEVEFVQYKSDLPIERNNNN